VATEYIHCCLVWEAEGGEWGNFGQVLGTLSLPVIGVFAMLAQEMLLS
jgi:hypothetical protein